MSNPFWAYWYFHIPNYVISALIWTLLGRFLLSLFVPQDWQNYIWLFFRRVTDPILDAVAIITPRFVHSLFMPLVAVFWLFVLRFVFWLALYQLGLAPTVATGTSP